MPSTPYKIKEETLNVPFFLQPLAEGVDLELVEVPGGEFDMGSPPEELDRTEAEDPVHRVKIPSFWMGTYPITQAQWRVLVGFEKVERELEPEPSYFKGDNRPVEQVNWHDANEFCQRLAKHTQLPYRLPSEAEWEYACRAGTITPFYFGESITTDLANYCGQDRETNNRTSLGYYGRGSRGGYREETTPVNYFNAPNRFGLCDMHGNILEWCLDRWHGNYDGAPTNGSAWLEGERDYFVLRGGSWNNDPSNCRSAYRNLNSPEVRVYIIGFRVVCAIREPPPLFAL